MLQPKDTDAEWIQKQDPYLCCLQEIHFRPKGILTESERMEKYIHANGKQKKAGAATLISDKIDVKIKKITRYKEGHYIMTKGSTQEEDIAIVNIYAPNITALQYMRQTEIKGETDSNTVIVGDFNNPLTPMDRSSTQKINKETNLK